MRKRWVCLETLPGRSSCSPRLQLPILSPPGPQSLGGKGASPFPGDSSDLMPRTHDIPQNRLNNGDKRKAIQMQCLKMKNSKTQEDVSGRIDVYYF